MKTFSHTFKILLIAILCFSCGFKTLDYSKVKKHKIEKISTAGNNEINFKVLNDLKQLFSNNSIEAEKIDINIRSKEEKKVKEKNKKNEITKYELKIDVNLEIKKETRLINIAISKKGEFQVNNRNLKTIQNEKKTKKDIIIALSDEILEKIIFELNDT